WRQAPQGARCRGRPRKAVSYKQPTLDALTFDASLGGVSCGSYRPRMVSIPVSTKSNCRCTSLPMHSVSWLRSTATISETFATESLARPVARAANRTFPGASAHFRLLVSGTHTTVLIRLLFKESHCTTTTGRRYPGPDPVGSPKLAHQISPWLITTRLASTPGVRPLG